MYNMIPGGRISGCREKRRTNMKDYLKPDLEYILFATEEIALGEGEGDSESNTFNEDDFS